MFTDARLIGKPFHAVTCRDWWEPYFWLSISNSITANLAGFTNKEAFYSGGVSNFDIPVEDEIVAVSMGTYSPRTVYCATRTKLYKVTNFNDSGYPGESSTAFSQFTFNAITSIACSNDYKKIYIADSGNIYVINIGPRTASQTILTGVHAHSFGVSNDDAYLYFTSQSRGTISKYKL